MPGSNPPLVEPLSIRPAQPGDTGELMELLNEIIRAGGTTAIENPLTGAEFERWFLSGPDCVACHVAEMRDFSIAGFQALERNSRFPEGWVDVATFTRRPRIAGVGSALFPATRNYAREAGFTMINATIRADNEAGLAYYAKLGFVDYSVATGVALRDGTPVDRISRRYALR